MTFEEFLEEIEILEAYPPRLADKERDARRSLFWDAVGQFPHAVLKRARKEYSQEDNEFFPSPGEIRQLCVDVEQRRRDAERPRYDTKFEPEAHEHHDPEPCEALKELFFWKYEAAHVECPGSVKATCPKCGQRHAVVNLTIEELKKRFPEHTQAWTSAHKGFMLCRKCEGKV